MMNEYIRELLSSLPLSVDELEPPIGEMSRDDVLYVLYQLEKVGRVTSSLEVRGNKTVRVFRVVKNIGR